MEIYEDQQVFSSSRIVVIQLGNRGSVCVSVAVRVAEPTTFFGAWSVIRVSTATVVSLTPSRLLILLKASTENAAGAKSVATLPYPSLAPSDSQTILTCASGKPFSFTKAYHAGRGFGAANVISAQLFLAHAPRPWPWFCPWWENELYF